MEITSAVIWLIQSVTVFQDTLSVLLVTQAALQLQDISLLLQDTQQGFPLPQDTQSAQLDT